MKLQKILCYYYYLELGVLLIKAYNHLIELILFILLELRLELVPGCERFHEVKWSAVLGKPRETATCSFLALVKLA